MDSHFPAKSIELSEGTDGTPNADLITLDINTDY